MVRFIDDWREDAARRDFTINAMSMDQAGTVFDYFGGRADLAQGIVRFVGDPARRIGEDYLRILRFFRFFARYAQGAADSLQAQYNVAYAQCMVGHGNKMEGYAGGPGPSYGYGAPAYAPPGYYAAPGY